MDLSQWSIWEWEWWYSLLIGQDANADGIFQPEERGILLEAMLNIWCTVIELLLTLLGAVLAVVPSEWAATGAELAPYVTVINGWIPLDFGIPLMVGFYGFVVVFSAVKLAVKMIPSIG